MKQTKNQTPCPLPEEIAGFEAGQAIERMMDNTTLWWRALAIFHAHYEHWEETWRASQAASEAERKCVHALRSSAANIGADRLAAAVTALEDAIGREARSTQHLEPLRAQVLACFLEVRQSAQAALELYSGRTEP